MRDEANVSFPGRQVQGFRKTRPVVSNVAHHHKFDRTEWKHFRPIAFILCSIILTELGHPTAVAQVKVRVNTVSKEALTGRFVKLTESTLNLRDDSGNTTTIQTSNILSISATDFDDVRIPLISTTPWIFLSTGDRLRMAPLVIDDESIVAKWNHFTALPPVSLPLELCSGIAMSVPSSPDRQGRHLDQILNHTEDVDRITLNNGDHVDGEFVSLLDKEVSLETSIGEIQTQIGQIQSLAFNPDLISQPNTLDDFAVLTLGDGSLLHLRTIETEGDLIIAEAIGGFDLKIPVTAIRSIQFFDSLRTSLTRVEVADTTTTPFLSMRREPRTNRNVIGGFISQHGQPASTGIGVTSGTRMTWFLDRKYSQFLTTIGIDDAAQGAGSVIFQILVDGTIAWESELLTGRSHPVTAPSIDLSEANELSLVVQFADRGNVLDYANWCNPILIRKSKEQ